MSAYFFPELSQLCSADVESLRDGLDAVAPLAAHLSRVNPSLAADLKRRAMLLGQVVDRVELALMPDVDDGQHQRIKAVHSWQDRNNGGVVALDQAGNLYQTSGVRTAWVLLQTQCSVAQAEEYVATLPGSWRHRCPPAWWS
jgi:hypothetical protein